LIFLPDFLEYLACIGGGAVLRFVFGNHVLDVARRELRRESDLVRLDPQVFDLLIYLIENRHRVVSKGDMLAAVWGGRIVSESTLASRINAARNAIGDDGKAQNLIRTAARKGFRFVADVRMESSEVLPRPAKEGTAEPGPTLPLPDRPAIAVLPFQNMGGDPEQDYFSDGISEDIITGLSKLRWFFVIARNSSFAYKGKSIPLKQIGEELGVGYLVEGSVRKSGDRVRITAQLNSAAAGSQLWAERYDRDLAEVFAVQDEITEAIVAAIAPQIYAAENFRVRRKPPENLDAWHLVMRALWQFWRVTREDNIAAQVLLEKAIAVDPDYAQALAVLAASHVLGTSMGWEDRTISVPLAERAALAAIRADGEDSWAHCALAGVHVWLGRSEDALAEFEQALSLNPNFALASAYYGQMLSWAGRSEDGIIAARRALRLSPRDPYSAMVANLAASAEFLGGNYHEAVRLAREAIRQRPDFVGVYRVLAAAAVMAGEIALAKASLQELRRAQPNISLAWIAEHLPVTQDERHSEAFRRARELYLEALRRAGLN
jgi:TolB-like protein/cytochrome c-type biogenesis protein CcmH/NrfG